MEHAHWANVYGTYILCSLWGGDLTSEQGKIKPLISGYSAPAILGHERAMSMLPKLCKLDDNGKGRQGLLVDRLEPNSWPWLQDSAEIACGFVSGVWKNITDYWRKQLSEKQDLNLLLISTLLVLWDTVPMLLCILFYTSQCLVVL